MSPCSVPTYHICYLQSHTIYHMTTRSLTSLVVITCNYSYLQYSHDSPPGCIIASSLASSIFVPIPYRSSILVICICYLLTQWLLWSHLTNDAYIIYYMFIDMSLSRESSIHTGHDLYYVPS